MDWIDDFLNASAEGLGRMDLTTLEPIDFLDITPLFAMEGVDRILKIIEKAEGHDPKELAKKLFTPSAIRVELMIMLIKAKLAGKSKEDMNKIAEFFGSLLKAWCTEDPFLKEGKNMVHTKDEVRGFLKFLKPANSTIARELGKLSNACYHLSHALYSDINPQLCYENFGPYDVSDEFGKGHLLVIKQFQELKPKRLWGNKIKDLPVHKIRIYCIYKDVELTVDALSHAIYEGDLINGLKYYAVDFDGEVISDITELKEVTEKIGLKSAEIWDALTSLDFENAKVMYLRQRCYNYVHLCNMIGVDWKPTRGMIKAVKDMSFPKHFWPRFNTKREEIVFWKAVMDPRTEDLPEALLDR